MKGYLFGLGAMLVGAGLMFVLMHGEVSADDYNKVKCEILESDTSRAADQVLSLPESELLFYNHKTHIYFNYCKIKDLTCVSATRGGYSCVKS